MTDDLVLVIRPGTVSSRLPGKVLAEVGRPMLALQLQRLRWVSHRSCSPPVTGRATTPWPTSGAELDVPAWSGPEADVLDRFVAALDAHPATTVARLTGDCPLADPGIVRRIVDVHQLDRGRLHVRRPAQASQGLDVEVLGADTLRAAAAEATDTPDREHVTPFVYRRPERFRLANVVGNDLGGRSWSVDVAADLGRSARSSTSSTTR